MGDYETIIAERKGPALVVRLNRPDKRNAINLCMMDELAAALRSADGDADVRGVALTGSDAFFSSGADLNDALREMGNAFSGVAYMTRWRELNALLENLSKPVVAAVEGPCRTGGFEMVLACDLRVAGRSASFAITSARIGTVPGSGGTQRLPRLVGIGNALDILLSADPIDAETGYRMGLINRLVEDGQALTTALGMIDVYAKRAPLSMKLLKRAVYCGMNMDLSSAIEFESFIVNTIYSTNDKQEGITAFLEKREPTFRGD